MSEAPALSRSTAAVARVLLVTGGSRGIGAACCRQAAAAGWDLAVNYTRDAAAAEQVVDAACGAAAGARWRVQADVADEAQVLAMFARIDAELGPLARAGQQRRHRRPCRSASTR